MCTDVLPLQVLLRQYTETSSLMCLWLKPWRVSAVCAAFTELHNVRLDQPLVLTQLLLVYWF